MKENLELLSEIVLNNQGCFKRVRRYYKDWHPELPNAVLVNGYQGKETRQELDIIKPIRIIEIK
jgi:hypothetical protein